MTYNSNPVITSSSATGSFSEDANTTGSTVDHVLTGTMNFTDSNKTDTHTTTSALKTAVWSGGSTLPTGALAKFQAGMTSSILTDSNGAGKLKWTFSEDDRDFDFLAKNETLVLTYEVTLKDNKGGSTKKTVTITITGTDDKPVFTSAAEATLTEQANKTLSFSDDTAHIAVNFTDVDLNNTGHTAKVLSVSASGNTDGLLPGSYGTTQLMSYFEIDNVVKNAGSSNGKVNTTFSAPDLSFDYLAAGEQLVVTYVVQVDDKKGGLSNQNVVVTINGTNDKPFVIGFPESRHLTEGEDLSGGNLTTNGDFHFTDIDLSDTHQVTTSVTATLSSGGTVPISEADLLAAFGAALEDDPDNPGNPNDSTGDLFGKVVWSFALPDSDVNFLAEGETLTLKYKVIVTDPSGASDVEEVCITICGTADSATLTKTASVPGGTADVAGEVITYTITYSNDGSSALTGVTVTDPSVGDLTFVGGDTDGDNELDAGETWTYTATHTVSQADIDFGGNTGDGTIVNTVTADSDQTDPISATTVVAVEQRRSIEVIKTADVSSADSAGDVINYTVNVTNTGNVTLSGLIVTDPQYTVVTPILDLESPVLGATPLLGPILVGDYNIGDTNENGFEDPGETFQYANIGDENQNGVEDPGETFEFANIGDTNGNGVQDPGETFQYYNAGDTNQNGIEDPGETFQILVSHVITDVDTDNNGQNDGDANLNGQFDAGETWSYTVSYTVTQDDIDNGGVVDPDLSHDNTATAVTAEGIEGSGSLSVDIEQNPDFAITKTADVTSVDAAGDVINYTVNVQNTGNMTLTGLTVTDPLVTNLAYASGDADSDGNLDLTETWTYTGSYTVLQSDIDSNGGGDGLIENTASATTDQGVSADDTASVTVVPPGPALILDMSLSQFIDVGPAGADAGGDLIQFSIELTNNTGGTLSDLDITDLLGDIPGTLQNPIPFSLAPGEEFVTTYNHFLTAADVTAGQVTDEVTATALDGMSQPQQVIEEWTVFF